jgi:hypothetical protein
VSGPECGPGSPVTGLALVLLVDWFIGPARLICIATVVGGTDLVDVTAAQDRPRYESAATKTSMGRG